MVKNAFSKVWIITLFVLVILIAGVSLFAAWDLNVKPPQERKDDTTIKFGKGREVTTTIDLNDLIISTGKVLVPVELENYNEDTQTKEIVYTFTLLWDEAEESLGSTGATPYQGTLEYTTTVTGIDASVVDLINVSFTSDDIIILKESKEVKISITLTIPENETEYLLIKGKEITIKLKIKIVDIKEKE